MPNLLENLNPEQLAAVTLPPQHALVLAGAGSGKTRVLTTRIAWLISTGNVSPHGLIAVTFTNKAAREMLTRISAMLPINMRGMWIGTFHGLCNRLLRAHHRDAGLPQTFTILDSADQLAVVKRVMKAMNVDEERFPPRQVQYFIAAAKEEGKRAGAVEVHDEFTRKYAEIYAAYDALCNKEGSVDFAELLLRSFELLTANEPLRTHYQNRFRHVLVDEFQDTNRLQYRWLKLLTGPETALFAVGDDDQSIYRFRGANVGNMADFERDYRVKNLIRLEQNYRSYGNILKAANALIAHNAKRLGKNLWTESGEGEPIRVYEATSDVSESSWLVEEIQALVRDGLSRRDIAILYRSNAQSRVLEHALFSAGISYRVYGGLRFFERTEIKHALAYLRLVANPDDDAAFLRVVNFPTRGIGARTLEQVQDAAAANGTSLWAAAQRAGGKVGGFVRIIEKLRADTAGLPLPEVVDHMLEASGLVAHYRTERDGADRVDNLNELVNAAAGFMHEEGLAGAPAFNLAAEDAAMAAGVASPVAGDAGGQVPTGTGGVADDGRVAVEGDGSMVGAGDASVVGDGDASVVGDGDANVIAIAPDPLAAFLAHAALESGENQAGEGSDAVQMMTVHSAKGLEFHVVFVTGLEEGLFPHEQSVNEDDGLEEERRLMYVAITRARTRLYVSFAQTRMLHGQTRYNVASRFLDELPAGVLKWLTAQKGRFLGNDAWASAGPPTGYRPKETATGIPYRIGQSVTHPKFGQGVIVSAEGNGSDARVQINFGAQGMKWLALEYAKLTPA